MKKFALVAILFAGCTAEPSDPAPVVETFVGHCSYVNLFSRGQECREYGGEWTVEGAEMDCRTQLGAAFVADGGCDVPSSLGTCTVKGMEDNVRIHFIGSDLSQCATSQTGCEVFGGGVYAASEACKGANEEPTGPVWPQPKLVCKDPKPGEPPGLSEGGKVCTWQMISGATEQGRSFEDYADCSAVRQQRPYFPVAENARIKEADPRTNDAAFMAEVNWVRGELRASACICCHSNSAPLGASNWNIDTPGNFANGFNGRGLAMGAGWINTVGFGAFPKEQNNGFERATPENPGLSAFPTTDQARIVRFFEGELAARGLTRDNFKDETYGAGPLDAQRFYVPTDCSADERIDADGTIRWRLGKARYIYVLEANATSPGVPPNLDLPAGTLWQVQVPTEGRAIGPGEVRYGTAPMGFTQRVPAAGAAPKLESGKRYYLYVLADIIQPLSRCLFTAP
jgi:hypothetical protein